MAKKRSGYRSKPKAPKKPKQGSPQQRQALIKSLTSKRIRLRNQGATLFETRDFFNGVDPFTDFSTLSTKSLQELKSKLTEKVEVENGKIYPANYLMAFNEYFKDEDATKYGSYKTASQSKLLKFKSLKEVRREKDRLATNAKNKMVARLNEAGFTDLAKRTQGLSNKKFFSIFSVAGGSLTYDDLYYNIVNQDVNEQIATASTLEHYLNIL